MPLGEVYLIPTVLQDDATALEALPPGIAHSLRNCQVFFAENIRTTRRHLKKINKDIVIDSYRWYTVGKAEPEIISAFIKELKAGQNIGIISEAGCPGIADPGQFLVAAAQEEGVTVHPLVGPSSILLALMASGMNGQHFQFWGYLPVESNARKAKIRELEAEAQKHNSTQIFIETPYRNQQLVKDILSAARPASRLCIACDITAATENIHTLTIGEWKKKNLDYLHKRPAIFLLDAGQGYRP